MQIKKGKLNLQLLSACEKREDTQQKEAFKDLLILRGANGGKLKFKDMKDKF